MYFLFLSFITDGEWYWFSLYNSEVKVFSNLFK